MGYVLQAALLFAAASILLAVFLHFLLKMYFRKLRFLYAFTVYFVFSWCAMMYFHFIKHEKSFPLPSDEYMIGEFNNNRETFEKLVHAYRTEYLLNDTSRSWDDAPEYKEAIKRLGIRYISHRSDMQWFENPYSPEAAKANFEKINSPEFMRSWSVRDRRMKSVVIHLNNSMRMSKKVGGDIVKTYLHLPMEPKIENGKLFYPYNHLFNPNEQGYFLVLSSLDGYQENWERGECFLKSIDKNWFLQLCRTY